MMYSFLVQSPVHPQEDFFTGTIEAVKREDTFLSESPFDILELGNFNKVPLVLGVNSGEGGYKVSKMLAYPEIQQYIGRRWKDYAPIFAHYDPNKTDVTDRLRQYYFGDSKYLNPGYDIPNMQQMMSDGNYFHPTHYTAIRHARYAPTFLFYFTYKTMRFPNLCNAYKAVRHDDWLPADLKVVASVMKEASKKYVAFKNTEPSYDWGKTIQVHKIKIFDYCIHKILVFMQGFVQSSKSL
jgi:carboxylesterase type B